MDQKKVMVFSILSLLMISMFATIVSAQATGGGIFQPVTDMFTSWQGGDLDLNVAKYLFWFLITLVLFVVSKWVPGIGSANKAIRWIIVIIIAFLATAYLQKSDIYTIMTSYSALGLVIAGFLPLLFLIGITFTSTREGGTTGYLLSQVAWIGYIVFMIFLVLRGMISDELNLGGIGAVYIGLIIFGILWIIFLGRVVTKWLTKQDVEQHVTDINKTMETVTALRKAEKKSADNLTNP